MKDKGLVLGVKYYQVSFWKKHKNGTESYSFGTFETELGFFVAKEYREMYLEIFSEIQQVTPLFWHEVNKEQYDVINFLQS